MYPSVTGFEMEMEDACLVKQVLEGFLRLTANRWQARSWNKFEEYNKSLCMSNMYPEADPENSVIIAPGEGKTPKNVLYDDD